MGARRKSRKRALDVLYAADVRGTDLDAALTAESLRAMGSPEKAAQWEYAREIVQGVIDHSVEIDEQITAFSREWPLARMPAVDRALARIGVWELIYNDELPDAVAISEAVEAAGEYSTDDSARFLNGLLGRIAQAK